MSEELAKAVMTWWNGDDAAELRDRAEGGLWWNKAPHGVADGNDAYIVYMMQSGSIEYTFTSQVERPTLQINIFVPYEYDDAEDITGQQKATQLRDWWDISFNKVKLPMFPDALDRDQTMISCMRVNYGEVISDPEKGYQVTLLYDVVYGYSTVAA